MSTLIVKLPNWLGDILFSMDLLYSLGLRFTKLGLCTSDQHAPLFEIFPIPNSEIIQYKSESWPFLSVNQFSTSINFKRIQVLYFRTPLVPRFFLNMPALKIYMDMEPKIVGFF